MQLLHTKNQATCTQKNPRTSTKINHAIWVSENDSTSSQTKPRNLSTHKITKHLNKKIMQPLHKKNHATSPQQKSRNLSTTKKSSNLHKKPCNLSEWVSEGKRNHTTSPHKTITQTKKKSSHKKSCNPFTSSHKNHATSSHKKSRTLFTFSHKKSRNLLTSSHKKITILKQFVNNTLTICNSHDVLHPN